MLALIGFVAMVVVLLPHLKEASKVETDHQSPGNVVVEIHWPNDLKVDVDLWVRAPDDIEVGTEIEITDASGQIARGVVLHSRPDFGEFRVGGTAEWSRPSDDSE